MFAFIFIANTLICLLIIIIIIRYWTNIWSV